MMRKAAVAAALVALLAGCAVGPNFRRPAPPPVTSFRPASDAETASSGPAMAYDVGTKVDFDWWRAFHSAALDALVARAIANNPQVDGAQARLRAAQAGLRAGYGAFFPAVGVSFDATRQKYSPSRLGVSGTGSVFSLFTPSIAISYALDLFGGNRRAVEGLRAQVEQQQQVTRGTYLTLAGTVATTAIARAQYHEQVTALIAIVAAEADEVQLARSRFRAGTATYASQLALEAQLESGRATLSQTRRQAQQADNLLAILVGDPPAAARLPELKLADLSLPGRLPLSLPSQLVRQRPDILATEAAAHAASANVGVATAALLPSITLSAGLGSSANSFEQIFAKGTGVWNYGAAVAAPLLEGGTLVNKRVAAKAQLQAALADYRQTVLQAFGQVADTLSALDQDADAEAAQQRADDAARTEYRMVAANRDAGLVSDADLQLAQAQAQQTRLALLSAEAVRLQDCVALFTALGGGWWTP
jgi:NodT family efflux transporter outer membrane factor (OMF) lipoprotein